MALVTGRCWRSRLMAYRAVPLTSLVPTQLCDCLIPHHPVALKAVLLGRRKSHLVLTEQAREQGIRYILRLRSDRVRLHRLRQRGRRARWTWAARCRAGDVQAVNGEVWIRAESMAAGY